MASYLFPPEWPMSSPALPGAAFLDGGGELGALMRAYDWTSTPLGPPEDWPRALKTAVRIMLTSRQPFWLGWGPQLTYLYNDPYKSIIGGKHPWALGKAFSQVWSEIWDVVGPMAEQVMTRDQGTYVEKQLLIMERHGYQEETYYTFSYSPVPDDEGRVAGLICANTEETGRVIGERQLALLRELAARTATARTWSDACSLAVEALRTNRRDLPFALVYVQDDDGEFQLCAASGGDAAIHAPSRWPLARALAEQEAVIVPLDAATAWPSGDWNRAPYNAAVLPVVASSGRAGVLVAGLNPFRRLDDAYRGFLELVSGQVASGIANAEAYEQERKRAEALAELDRAKTTFFSNVSHEFRTPLTLMLGPIEELLSKADVAGSREDQASLSTIQRNGERLLKLVNTLLDFARIEAGRAQMSFEATDIAAFTSELAANFRAACERAGLTLTVDTRTAGEPAWIDRDMWEKIVLNLLSNAFKFTLRGGITVKLRERDEGFVFTVRDTGAGIPAESLPKMFQRFHRVEGTPGRSHEGSGIGLALVQELVKLHGGTIEVASVEGEGTQFTITIPKGHDHLPPGHLRKSDGEPAAAARARAFVQEAMSWLPDASSTPLPTSAAAGAPRILVADDNADLRQYLHRLLGAEYDVEVVNDGEQALAAMRARRPELVVSDIMMPVLDGIGLVRAIREDAQLRTTPVILLSARAGEEARIEGMASGADDYLVKPFSARELLVRVGALLRAAEVRREAMEALRESDRRKDEFIATLSHELRNPLAPIRNALHILRMGREPNPQVARVQEMLERQVNHLVRLVDDLLEISRISRGTLELKREPVELGAIVRHSVETAEPLIQAAGHRLTVSMPGENLWLNGDAVRLGQVVGNVLNNAAKYTDRGGTIEVSAQRIAENVVLSVRDNGQGIAEGDRETIFEMFTRGQDARSQGGLGIGLALARKLIDMHGGRIEALSDGLGKGSEFRITLPLAAQSAPGESITGRLGLALEGRRILVVDDNRDAADSLAMILRILGGDVEVARSGAEALRMLKDFDASIVLLDIGMPEMDGYEVARRIRARSSGDSRPAIVALTGWGQDQDRARAREAGFDHHLTKPAEISALHSLLAQL
jgi:signal transduction histidine kinase